MIDKDKYYSAFEISLAGFIPHAKTTNSVVSWLKRYKEKYPKRVIVRNFADYKRADGKRVENKRYSIKGENLISLIAHIEDGSI